MSEITGLTSKYESIAQFKWHDVALEYLNSEADTRGIFKGNQGGATATAMMDVVLRCLGVHPVAKRNRFDKPIRCVSKCVPKGKDDEQNQQYVEFKKRFPPELIKQDVTARGTTMVLRDPFGGSDKKLEFMASTQDIDAFMSVQRAAYYQDEEIARIKWDENQMRLLAANGDCSITMTPVRGIDWTFDSIWRRARRIFRSKIICEKFNFKRVEDMGMDTSIECFCWATDDNPVMDGPTLERIFADIDDSDELAMRRYGVFRQVSGRVYKSFDPAVHVIPFDKWFDIARFKKFWSYRVIDFHPQKDWNITWLAISPENEWFVWHEKAAKHEHATTRDIREQIKEESLLDEDNMFNRATIIDPLAKMKQPNTGFSVFEDLSMGDLGLRRCTTADTKSESGRMNIKLRLKNAADCGVPENNRNYSSSEDERYGFRKPTIWIMDNCKGHVDHLQNWRYRDYQQEHIKAVKVTKMMTEKWSDYCRNLEFVGALNPVFYDMPQEDHYEPSKLFQGRRNAA